MASTRPLNLSAEGTTEPSSESRPVWWSDVLTPAAYPEKTSTVHVKETHISWVFLTDRHAYKVHKPVRYSFVDFSTIDRRKTDCHNELDLNRRLAPQVYLDVVPLVRTMAGRYRFTKPNDPDIDKIVDYAVKMVRLPDDACLSNVLQRRPLRGHEIAALADVLVEFYQRLPPATLTTQEYVRRVERHIQDNHRDVQGRIAATQRDLLHRLLQAQLFFLRIFPHELMTRVQDGRIVEGHGDLRPEHVYMLTRPVVIDTVEFSAELRQIDVLDELAFLAMECDRLGHSAVGEQVRSLYRSGCNDPGNDRLWNFYKLYRAMVRAKVHALRADQVAQQDRSRHLAEARDYLLLAEQYASHVAPHLLLVIGGISGSGKSTLARQLADELAIPRWSTDDLRAQLAASGETMLAGTAKYSVTSRDWIYEQLFQHARVPLQKGLSVLLDGTFLKSRWRQAAYDLAVKCQAYPWFIRCDCPVPVAQARIQERKNDTSEATAELVGKQWEEISAEPWTEPGVEVDTTECLAAQVNTVYQSLRTQLEMTSHRAHRHPRGRSS